jgi:hypothetical protein
LTLDVAGITHTGVGGTSSVSYKYPDGFFPLYGSTTVNITATFPSVKVNVVSVNNGTGAYKIECFNGSQSIGVAADSVTRTFTVADFANLSPASICNVVLTGIGANTVASVLSVSGVSASGGVANLTFTGPVPPTTTTVAPVTTTVAPTTTVATTILPTTTVAPTTTTPVKVSVVTKCYKKVGKKYVSIKCPKK